jgi:hypothetical protein
MRNPLFSRWFWDGAFRGDRPDFSHPEFGEFLDEKIHSHGLDEGLAKPDPTGWSGSPGGGKGLVGDFVGRDLSQTHPGFRSFPIENNGGISRTETKNIHGVVGLFRGKLS